MACSTLPTVSCKLLRNIMSAAPTSWNLDDVDAFLGEPAGYVSLLDDTVSLDGVSGVDGVGGVDGVVLDESLLDLNFDDNSLMDWSIMYNNPVTSHHPEGSVLGKRLPSESLSASSAKTPPPSPCGVTPQPYVSEELCAPAQPKRRKSRKTRRPRPRATAQHAAQHAARPEQKALQSQQNVPAHVPVVSVHNKSEGAVTHESPVQAPLKSVHRDHHQHRHFVRPDALQQKFLAMTLRIFKNTAVCV